MGFWSAAAYVLDKIPLEKMLSKPPDDRERLQRLRQALEPPKKAAPAVAEAPDTEQPATLPVRRSAFHRPAPRQVGVDQVTTQETIDYQDRELGKLLLAMERHYRQGLRIAGKICDCGATKHLLD
ncbi:MAG: hypothetical protein Q8R28_01530, partial [Dehalococcoidia bacterium]|nr:hypothetical protein [Dehalococcoidia bacterium]